MKPASPLSFFNSGRKTKLSQVEIEVLIELLPGASILIERKNGQVLFANTGVTKLTSYTRAELCQLKLSDILAENSQTGPAEKEKQSPEGSIGAEPGVSPRAEPSVSPKADPRDSLGAETVDGLLLKRNGSNIAVQVTQTLLGQSGKFSIVTFEPVKTRQLPLTDLQLQDQFWQSLYQMAVAINEPAEEKALTQAIMAGHELIKTSMIGYYQLEELSEEEAALQTGIAAGREVLKRKVFVGDDSALPDLLSPQELVNLRAPQLWTAGKRMLSLLHRAARANEYSFIATAPVGLPEMNGLIVIGETDKQPTTHILRLAQLLAAVITTLTRQHEALKTLEAALLAKSDELAVCTTAADAVKDGLLITSPDLIIRKINPSAEMTLGYTSREVLGIPIEKVIIGTGALTAALATAQEGRPTYDVGQMQLYRRNGEAFLAQVRTLPVILGEKLTAIIIQFEDLTEQEQIQERSRQLEQQAFLGEFTAVFAHEVRNPINNISTGLQLLELSIPGEDPNHEVVMRLQTDCDRLTEQMRSVLSFARSAEYEMESVNVERLLRSLLDRLKPRIVKENITPRIQADPNLPTIEGSPRVLEQVFNNLITNAVQAMRGTNGQLVVKINKVTNPHGPTYVKISIADTGPGIAKENLDKIFQPFYTTKHDGTGLGLPIAKRIITAHKGRIQVESFPGGTVFSVEIPANEAVVE
jgi:two-component system, NtrC family, sensor histidine kinase AtoS